MTGSNIPVHKAVAAVVAVKDQQNAVEWYKKLLGRGPDLVPIEGVAEWQVVENAWLQVKTDPVRAGGSSVVIAVNDIDAQIKACAAADMPHGEIIEYPGIARRIELIDPDENMIAFVQPLAEH